MDEAVDYMKSISGDLLEGMKNAMLCKVEKFDAKKMKAELTPLLRSKNKKGEFEDVQLLIEVPVAHLRAGTFIIRPPYKNGDIVVAIFADGDIDNILLSGEKSNPNSNRKHSLDDAIVISGLMPFTKELPEEHSEDLVIGKEDFESKLVFKKDGSIEIKSNKRVTISGPTNSSTWN